MDRVAAPEGLCTSFDKERRPRGMAPSAPFAHTIRSVRPTRP